MGLQDEIKNAVNWHAEHIEAEESVRTALHKMVKNNSSALVVKRGPIVAGVLTDIDLMKCIVAKKDLDRTTVASFMTACELITSGATKKSACAQLYQSESVENALKVMEAAGVHNLLVCGDKEQVGMVALRDLLKFVSA